MKNRLFLILILFIVFSQKSAFCIDIAEAERIALESSKEIKNTRELINISGLKLRLDLRSFFPSIAVNFDVGKQTNIFSPDSETIRFGVNLNQPVFNGGRTVCLHKLAEIQLDLQKAALEKQIDELRNQVWQLYFALLLNREKLKLLEELLKISMEQLKIAESKYNMGSSTKLDYLEAVITVRNMELDILDTKTEAAALSQDFAIMLGYSPCFFENQPLQLTGSINREYSGLSLWKTNAAEYSEIALERNLKLLQKQVSLYQLETEYNIMKNSFIPKLSLEASLYIQGTGFPLYEPVGSLSLKLDFPYSAIPSDLTIGTGVHNRNQYSLSSGLSSSLLPDTSFITDTRSAAVSLKQQSEALDELEIEIERSINLVLERLEHGRLRLEIRRNAQELQKERLEIMEARYQLGMVKESELLKARADFYREEIGLLEGVHELMNSERELETILGIGLGQIKQFTEVANKNIDIFKTD